MLVIFNQLDGTIAKKFCFVNKNFYSEYKLRNMQVQHIHSVKLLLTTTLTSHLFRKTFTEKPIPARIPSLSP